MSPPTTFTFLSASIPEKKIRIPYNLNAPRTYTHNVARILISVINMWDMYLAMALLYISTSVKRKSAGRKRGEKHLWAVCIPFHSVFDMFATRSVAEERLFSDRYA